MSRLHQVRTECYLKRKRGNTNKFEEAMPDDMLLQEKWPKFLRMLPGALPGGTAQALPEIRKMCPGKPMTLEEVQEECSNREAQFTTPFVRGRDKNTPDLPARPLPAAEVFAINQQYLQLKVSFEAERRGQDAGTAIGQAEQTIIGHAAANQEENARMLQVLTQGQRELAQDIKAIGGKRLACTEGPWYIEAEGGCFYQHESGHFRELSATTPDTEARYAKIIKRKENPNGTATVTYADGNDAILDAVVADALRADPVYTGKAVSIKRRGKFRGLQGEVVKEPKPALGKPLGEETDSFSVLPVGAAKPATFKRAEVEFVEEPDRIDASGAEAESPGGDRPPPEPACVKRKAPETADHEAKRHNCSPDQAAENAPVESASQEAAARPAAPPAAVPAGECENDVPVCPAAPTEANASNQATGLQESSLPDVLSDDGTRTLKLTVLETATCSTASGSDSPAASVNSSDHSGLATWQPA